MVWQMQTGGAFWYTRPRDPGSVATARPPQSQMSALKKDFGLGQTGTATTFLEVRNLFGQRDDTSTGFRWIQYGLQKPPPGDSKFDTSAIFLS